MSKENVIGITSCGAYIPLWRLGPGTIGWRFPTERAVASFDEDSVTMAVAAARDCLSGLDPSNLNGLYFATTSSPYNEKQAAALIAAACDVGRDSLTSDFTGSLRSSTIALRSALDSIKAGTVKRLLVTAADSRSVPSGSEFEANIGDGAAALLLGNSEVIATFEGSHSITDQIYDVWRSNNETYLRSWEDRFVLQEGYLCVVKEAVSKLLKEQNLSPKDIAKFVLYGPDPRRHSELASSLGFDIKKQVQEPLFGKAGSCGTAHCLMLLAAALEEAKAGDNILLASYGDGSDALLFQVTEHIDKFKSNIRRRVSGYLQSKKMINNYNDYLRWRGILQTATGVSRPPRLGPSPVALHRERDRVLRLYGAKCNRCGTVQYPPQRVCVKCSNKDSFTKIRLADKRAEIYTYSMNYIGTGPVRPDVIAVINFQGGGRMLCSITDYDTKEIKIGMPVEMSFRKVEYAGGIHNYFWKGVPFRTSLDKGETH